MERPEIPAGTRFSRLVTTGETITKNGKLYEKCVCDCGGEKYIERFHLTHGKAKSCGCFRKELVIARTKTHGLTRSRIYKIYNDLKYRCTHKNYRDYKRYGGKGVRCERNSFEEFYKDMGVEYEKHVKEHGLKNTTIDRINSDGNYCKENCRWATKYEQNNNRKSNREVVYKGKLYKSMRVLCDELGLNYKRIRTRILRGWDVTEAVETTKNGRCKRE